MSDALAGKVVLVTGGGRGIGRAIADQLAAAGAVVWATSRTAPSPAAILTPAPGGVQRVGLDVTDAASVQAVFAALDRVHGRIDVLVNNAGMGVFKPFEDITLSEFRQVMDTNLVGAFLCAQAAYTRMKSGLGGRIVNIGSIAGAMPLEQNGAYGVSKYGLAGLSAILNEEGKHHNIRVTLLTLGAVYTDIWKDRSGFHESDMLQVDDVASAVLEIAQRPLHVRIDAITLLPSKGRL